MNLVAIRTASIATSKQSVAVAADDRERRVGVAAVDRLEQIRLLGLGRHARRRTGTLRVDHDERQLGGDREAEHFGLEGDPGPELEVTPRAPA